MELPSCVLVSFRWALIPWCTLWWSFALFDETFQTIRHVPFNNGACIYDVELLEESLAVIVRTGEIKKELDMDICALEESDIRWRWWRWQWSFVMHGLRSLRSDSVKNFENWNVINFGLTGQRVIHVYTYILRHPRNCTTILVIWLTFFNIL